MKRSTFFFIILFCLTIPVIAQTDSSALFDLRRQVNDLRSAVDSIRNSGTGDDFEAVEERIDRQLSEVDAKIAALARATAPIALNPAITTFINFAARKDNSAVLDETGTASLENRMYVRTVEVDLRAPVDPYADAVTILAVENEAGNGYAVDAEEAYVIVKRLPIVETAPLGLKLKIGKFRAPFGVNNKIHMHDLPWTTRPLPVMKYLGTEHGEFFESGYNTAGIEGNFFLPSPVPGATVEMQLAMMQAGGIGLAQGISGDQPSLVGRIALSRDYENEHFFLLGASLFNESGVNTTQLFGTDVMYKWSPAERKSSRSLIIGGELFFGTHSAQDTAAMITTRHPFGWFGYLQYQISSNMYIGYRFDRIEEPSNTSAHTQLMSLTASYYTTEFLRLRAGIEQKRSDLFSPGTPSSILSFFFDVNVVFGSHPVEPYWVNR